MWMECNKDPRLTTVKLETNNLQLGEIREEFPEEIAFELALKG